MFTASYVYGCFLSFPADCHTGLGNAKKDRQRTASWGEHMHVYGIIGGT